MGLNVQSGHSKVGAGWCTLSLLPLIHFSLNSTGPQILLHLQPSRCVFFRNSSGPLFLFRQLLQRFFHAPPAITFRAMLVGQARQDVSAHSVPLFFFCLSLSPCLFLPVFFLSFTGLRTGGVSGAMGTSDSSFPIRHPFCPCRWIDGGRWRGARARIAHFLSSLTLSRGLGRASGRRGGWTSC